MSERLRHTINFTDSATPTRRAVASGLRARRTGVLGAEIWVNILAVGQPTPTDPASFTFVALDTRTPYTLDFTGADGGKIAHYMLRWVNTKSEKGPWNGTATATLGS